MYPTQSIPGFLSPTTCFYVYSKTTHKWSVVKNHLIIYCLGCTKQNAQKRPRYEACEQDKGRSPHRE